MMETELGDKQAETNLANEIDLNKSDYRGRTSTLCQGCGHNSISSQIIAAFYELSVPPERIIKMSGIGCSSKSPAYFLSRSFGFNSLHGRMPTITTGAVMVNHSLKAIGISGDGDTASIGFSHFKNIVRRNVPMIYIIENNGVYGLTKGQFSATADKGLELKNVGVNPFMPIDICMEALVAGAGFVARSFAGDPRQVKELLKAAFHFQGTAVLDIVSPCVTFNNRDESSKSYRWGRARKEPLHDITWVPRREEIRVEFEPGEVLDVDMHDGSQLRFKKLEYEYDPTDRISALKMLEETSRGGVLVTGVIYINEDTPPLDETENLVDLPLAQLSDDALRPSKETLDTFIERYR
ncbi:MAG: 2-oxoacid:ferredoxin oxidoreductase subunit beta [Anaerolineales bacterium]|jgi:2-oxoglutarate ferredoxin oxidoreductase subunit beta|nr:2-oxoacid:ferredoxin oxidoreductase subunit beta [Anaerolineales bacterium]